MANHDWVVIEVRTYQIDDVPSAAEAIRLVKLGTAYTINVTTQAHVLKPKAEAAVKP